MELRSTEEDINEMVLQYECLRDSKIACNELNNSKTNDKLDELLLSQFKCLPEIVDDSHDNAKNIDDANGQATKNCKEVLEAFEGLQSRLSSEEMSSKMDRFEKRLNEKDAVTQKPRYGEKTQLRVKSLLDKYSKLETGINMAFYGTSVRPDNENEAPTTNNTIVNILRTILQEEENKKSDEENAKRLKLQEEEARRLRAEQEQLQAQREKEEIERLQRLQEEQQIAKLAEQSRQKQKQEQEEEQQRQKEWLDSIGKPGIPAVEAQLNKLIENTSTDSNDRKVALNSLHTIFTQIVKHPEQVNFRKIRCDHPKFVQDVGRHPGGREILIAAGFGLGISKKSADSEEEVPCYICKEPNLETDFDGWSEWYDLLKGTLQVIQQKL